MTKVNQIDITPFKNENTVLHGSVMTAIMSYGFFLWDHEEIIF